jgi:NAD(P)H-flavin reductase
MADASLLSLDIARGVPFSPGQYMNLWIPYASIWPHGYRLMIAWWEENQSTLTLFFLAEDQPGLCRRIRQYVVPPSPGTVDESSHRWRPPFGLPFSHNVMTPAESSSESSESSLLTLFNGPYGLQDDFSKYGTVVAFASGAGIAPVMAHVKALVDGNLNFNVSTRRIALYWQIEKEGNRLSADGPSIH